MLLIVFFAPLLLFSHQTDGTNSITWYEPPPVETSTNDSVVKTHNIQLFEGSTNRQLSWNFTLGQNQVLNAVQLLSGDDVIGSIFPPGQPTILIAFKDRFNISWINSQKVTLVIFTVTALNNGEFSCKVSTGGGSNIWTRTINVDVVAPAIFINVSSDNQTVREGLDLQLFCEASGKPNPSITWTVTLQSGSESGILKRGPSLDFKNISRADAGTYHCKASNGVGNPATHAIKVAVLFPPNITLQNEYYVSREKSVSLHCQVDGYPLPTITWTPCENMCDKSRLNISKVQADAVYNCSVTNYLGNATASTSLIIGAKKINLTLTITIETCTEGDTSFWDKLQEAVDDIFANRNDYVGATLIKTRCGSLIVDLALEFKSVVSEALVLSTLRDGVIGGKLGEFTVNASSIVGISVIESTATPPTFITTTKPPDDNNIGLIVGASVGGFIMLVIIIAVVIWCVRKNNKDKDKKKKSKTSNKEVGDNDAEGHQMSRFQGGRPTSGHGNNGYENTGSIPRPPVANAGKKDKKEKKGQAEEDKPVGVVYAQVDKDKRTRKSKEPENLYDQAARPNSKTPGQLQYISPEDLQQGRQSMPRNSGTQPKKPEAYTETQYAVLV